MQAPLLACLIIGSIIAVRLSRTKPNIPERCRRKPLGKSCGECGRANIPKGIARPLIIGGQPVEPINKYPWVVGLKAIFPDHEEITCGGTVLNEYFVLTAAHCVASEVITSDIKMAIHFLDNTTGTIAEMIPHPKFKFVNTTDTLMENDIALIKLKNPIKCNGYKRPICLPPPGRKLSNGNLVTIYGWGQDYIGLPKLNQTTYIEDQVLKEVTMALLDHKTCEDIIAWYKTRVMYCLYGAGEQGVCRGDSGGSMVNEEGHKYTIYGIAHGVPLKTCDTRLPCLYFSVSPYLKWINKVTGAKHTNPRYGQRNLCF